MPFADSRSLRWLSAALLSLLIIGALDVALGSDIQLTGTFLLGPLLASIGCRPRVVAWIGVLAVLIATFAAALTKVLDDPSVLLRLVVVAIGGGFAVWAATVRERYAQAERRADESFAVLDSFYEQAPVGLAYFDANARYVRINDRLAEINGIPADQHIGRTVREVLPDLDPQVARQIEDVVRRGEPIREVEVRGETPAAPGVPREWLVTYWPVRHEDGGVLGAGAVVLEITDRKRAERRMSFLAEAGALLDSALDEEDTAFAVARLLAREYADQVVVVVADRQGTFRRLGWAARTAKGRRALERAVSLPLDQRSSSPVIQVARSGRRKVVIIDDEQMRRIAAGDPARLKAIQELRIRTTFVLPLRARGRVIGAIAAGVEEVLADSVRDERLALFTDIATRAALAIDNARLYAERSHVARTLQRSLLPPELPAIPGVELSARYRPAGSGNEVGGDFYDCFETPSGSWAVSIGDVCGKGAEAAALTALARYTLRAAVLHSHEPGSVLRELNEALRRQHDDFRFCTVGYVNLRAREGGGLVGRFASGGHPLPLVLRADGTVDQPGEPGTLLGIVPDVVLPETDLVLGPGDALVLFTDGVIEASPLDDALGPDQLAELLRTCRGLDASGIARTIEQAVLDLREGELRDDVAILVLRAFASDRAGVAAPS